DHYNMIFIAPPTTPIYTLSLHDALPIFGAEGMLINVKKDGEFRTDRLPAFNISPKDVAGAGDSFFTSASMALCVGADIWHSSYLDRKSTRLNSSHSQISYAVFCLKKKYQQRNFAFWGYVALVWTGLLTFLTTLSRDYKTYCEAIGLPVPSLPTYAELFCVSTYSMY